MLVVMFLECGLGLVPRCIPMTKRWENALSYMNCFSAGIFLAMSLVHIMPEAAEIWGSWVKSANIERAFPLPYVLYLAGYLLILFTDKVIASKFRQPAENQVV
jgi:solute carrier family 39 (zinc transporter), member 1/2/3